MQRKIITFDGAGGSGKSTQAYKIAKVLDGKVISFDIVMNVFSTMQYLSTGRPFDDGSCFKVLTHVATYHMLTSHESNWSRHNVMCIEDGFWFPVINLLGGANEDKRYEFVEIFRGLLSYNDMHPTTSIFLDIPPHQGLIRRIEREENYKISSIEIEKVEKDQTDWFVRQLQTFRWLAKIFPYCHVVDGTKSENEVAGEIMEIIRNS